VRKALYIVQHYHRPRARRKLRQRRVEPFLQLTIFRRITESRGHRFRKLLGGAHLFPPSQIERRICDDAIEPGTERLRGIEPIESLVRAQKSFLHRVLCIFMSHDDRSRHYIRTALVQSHEPAETPVVALPGQTYELSLFIRNT
jgi:hypothetical protein